MKGVQLCSSNYDYGKCRIVVVNNSREFGPRAWTPRRDTPNSFECFGNSGIPSKLN